MKILHWLCRGPQGCFRHSLPLAYVNMEFLFVSWFFFGKPRSVDLGMVSFLSQILSCWYLVHCCNDFWHQLPWVRLHSWETVLCKTTLTWDTSKVRVPRLPAFQTKPTSVGSHYPLGFDNLLERLTELKKVLYLWLQVYKVKGYKSEPAKREGT